MKTLLPKKLFNEYLNGNHIVGLDEEPMPLNIRVVDDDHAIEHNEGQQMFDRTKKHIQKPFPHANR